MKQVFAVCDSEQEYTKRMLEYVSGNCNLPFEVQMFTEVKEFAEFCRKRPVELLLINEHLFCDDLLDLKIGSIVLLRDGDSRNISPEDLFGNSSAEKKEQTAVYKYQAARQVVREVMDCYSAERRALKAPAIGKRTIRKIGIVNPADAGLRLTFAQTMGRILAEEAPTLFCDLDPFTVMEQENGGTEQTMSELLYYFRQKKEGLIYKLSGMTGHMGRLDYVPSADSPEDVMELEGKEWVRFFQEILRTGVYENLVLNFGCGINGQEDILEFCDVLYLPCSGTRAEEAVSRRFSEWFRRTGGTEEKIHRVAFRPRCGSPMDGGVWDEPAQSQDAERRVREILWEERKQNGYGGNKGAADVPAGGERRP